MEIHQPVRHLKKEGDYFACTDFRKPGSQDDFCCASCSTDWRPEANSRIVRGNSREQNALAKTAD